MLRCRSRSRSAAASSSSPAKIPDQSFTLLFCRDRRAPTAVATAHQEEEQHGVLAPPLLRRIASTSSDVNRRFNPIRMQPRPGMDEEGADSLQTHYLKQA